MGNDDAADGEPNEWIEWLERHFGRHEQLAEFIGLPEAQARNAAASSGVTDVRMIVLDRPREDGKFYSLSADHRSARLNLAVIGGRVVRAAYF